MSSDREWQIGIVGTFDVENYGDLLFPLLAESALRARLGRVRIQPFSHHTRTPPAWPYAVTSLTELPRIMPTLDALLIGGGFIIRFDPDVAPGYGSASPDIHHPTGYWLAPALLAIDAHVPVIWNAPGMHANPVPEWAAPLVQFALRRSSYIAVRDELSRQELSRFVDADAIHVRPDTGFGLQALLPPQRSDALTQLRARTGISRPYILAHAATATRDVLMELAKHRQLLSEYDVVALPVGPVLSDSPEIFDDILPDILHLPAWPDPLLLAELIRESAAVIGGSYHLAITAVVSGVPVFTTADLSIGKNTALRDLAGVFPAAGIGEDLDWLRAHLVRRAADHPDRAAALRTHWDMVAASVRQGPTHHQRDPLWWQALPASMQHFQNLFERAELRNVRLQQRIDDLEQSTSWRITASLRYLTQKLLGKRDR